MSPREESDDQDTEAIMKKRVAIIGSGVSGILAIKACKEEEDIFSEIVCYEKTSDIGGLWKYREIANNNNNNSDSKVSDDSPTVDIPTVMNTTIANSSKEMSAFSDFPPSPESPNFMHHKVMLKYIESYAEKFACLPHVQLNQEVIEVSRFQNKWKIHLKDHNDNQKERNEYFDAVLVCTGHHGRPFIPSFPGLNKFQGQVMHTQYYKKPDSFSGKKVLVVGVGNSGLDIAVELSSVADSVLLSTRSGCWILPRLGFRGGRPYDTSFLTRNMHFLKDIIPPKIVSHIIETMLNRRFDHELFGLRPAHPLFHEHPTINDQLASKILCGVVQVKGDVREVTKTGVRFEGEEEQIKELDCILLATGFHVDYSFLCEDMRKEIINSECNSVNLYKYVFPILDDEVEKGGDRPSSTLAFIGVPNALGPFIPFAEIQSRWVVQVLKGEAKLPSAKEMREGLVVQEKKRKLKFTDTPRHGCNVEWIPYLDEVAKEIGCNVNFRSLFWSDISLWKRLFFGPSVPYQYRLNGPHSCPDAREIIMTTKERMDIPLKVNRTAVLGKDQVSTNVKYWDHYFVYTFFWGVLAVFVMDIFFIYAS